MNAICMTAYNRPEYLRQTLAALKACPELPQFEVFVSVDPSDKSYLIYKELCHPDHVHTNTTRRGSSDNVRWVIEWAWCRGADFMLYLDDDCVVSPDALRLALWFKDKAQDFACLELFSRNREPAGPDAIEQHPTFNALGWACSVKDYDGLLHRAWHDKEQPLYDLAMHKVMTDAGALALRPRLSRSKHIGRLNGTNNTPEYFDQHWTGYNFSEQPYDGPYKICYPNHEQ